MTQLKNWRDGVNTLSKDDTYYTDIEQYIDDTYEKIENIIGLKTNLFNHQKHIIKAMYDLEMTRDFDIKVKKKNRELIYKIKSNAGVLSEPVGSGKTIDILSLILINKVPRALRDITDLNIYKGSNRTRGFTGIIRKKFNIILTPTIIFVGVSVINQWIGSIKTFTNLRVFSVHDVRDLQKLINKIIDRSINQYDIVLVKNGKITRPIIMPDNIIIEDKNNNKSTLYIYNVISNLRNFCWARVVVDDFDTIKLPHNASSLSSLFTWFISSTKKRMTNKTNYNTQFTKTDDLLMYSNYNCGKIMNNPILFHNLNIRNSPEFIKKSNMISSPKFYAYIFINQNNKFMGLLGAMNDAEASEVMEMLNGDAIETAAEKIGIKSTNVSDIFQTILGNQYNKYKKAKDVLEYIELVEPLQGNRKSMESNIDTADTYKKSDLFNKRPIEYNYPNLKNLLDSTKKEYIEIKKNSGIAIERVKNNIKEGECVICSSDLDDEDEDIIIVKCCCITVCGMCCFGTIFPNKSQHGQCSNCREKLTLKSLIYLNGNFDLNNIIEENITSDEENITSDEEKEKSERDKYTAILEIIKGEKPIEQLEVDININNLLNGNCKTKVVSYNKVLIFANYEETLDKINKLLHTNNIKFWKLGGSHSSISNIVNEFDNCNQSCALIINSIKHCAGLNLQSCTDLVFAHKILDSNIETQVVGRGQRLGRTSQLKVHYMFYQNEYDYMKKNNTIREI